MKRQLFVLGAVLFVISCDDGNREESAAPDYQLDGASSGGDASDDAASVAADAVGSPPPGTTAANPPSAPVPPSEAVKRTNIDESIRRIWRETPYEIVDIAYGDETLRAVGDSGASYEAGISVTLRFPSGWLAECIGPNSPWGCQHIDSNMMQSSRRPIAAGESRTYSGRLVMGRMRQDGEWQSKSGQWQAVEPPWDARVTWQQS